MLTVRSPILAIPVLVALLLPAVAVPLPVEEAPRFAFLVSLDHPPSAADAALLAATGLTPLRAYPFGVILAVGPSSAASAAAGLPGVTGLVRDEPLQLALDSSAVVVRAREAWDARSTSAPLVVNGSVVDGRGVGVAVIDTGLDRRHPDFASVGVNLRWACTTPGLAELTSGYEKCFGNFVLDGFDTSCQDSAWTPVIHTDIIGHGTHVAGTILGTGAASSGRFAGTAPGATLYSLGSAEGLSVLWALEALAWVLCNHDQVSPPIRVINNSWGGNGAYDPADPINKAVDALVAEGVTVVFAAGNDGPRDGTVGRNSRNPTPGVISVANFHDLGNVTRNGVIDASSSRCKATDAPAACPDLAAPGTDIIAAAAGGSFIQATNPEPSYAPRYAWATGTSMAAPHVSGVVALLLQVHPGLTPAQIEDILEDTAYKFPAGGPYAVADPSNGGLPLSTTAGHGLLDARAALARVHALVGTSMPQVVGDPHVYTPNADPQILAGAQWRAPRNLQVGLSERSMVSGDLAAWPLLAGQSCRWRIEAPDGSVTLRTCALAADGSAGRRMDTTFTFTQLGTHTVEAQVLFAGTWRAVDSFTVRTA